jgi:16S rRNA (adenine1518-N6/adenine1519-N6)-dimethyltransferase
VGRRFGQHFLARKSILEKIAEAACGGAVSDGTALGEPASGEEAQPCVIEIGPGRGALTECLLERAALVIAIEIDPMLVLYLRQKFRDAIEAGRLALIEGDVLKTDIAALAGGRRAVIAGNLPYYITSPILQQVFALGAAWERGVFLVQAEVADRLAAKPGGRDYGYLSVLAQVYSRPEVLFPVERGAFRPPPKVDSAVVRLEPRVGRAWEIADVEGFLKFASACFQHKRKTLRNNLAPLYGRERMDALPEGRMRAEQLGVEELAALQAKLGAPA